jgi:FMNH2-dependent dimethyl sulfone monooxygenase
MVAVRPNFHHPALLAKQAANIDRISGGRLALNVVSSWWKEEAEQYGLAFDQHDDRYARTAEWLTVVDGLWREEALHHEGERYQLKNAIVEPKPVRRPVIYAGGESEAAKTLIARQCDAYVMHGDPVEAIAPKIADMRAGARKRAARRCRSEWPPTPSSATARRRPSASSSGSPPCPPPRRLASPTSTSGCRAPSSSGR